MRLSSITKSDFQVKIDKFLNFWVDKFPEKFFLLLDFVFHILNNNSEFITLC